MTDKTRFAYEPAYKHATTLNLVLLAEFLTTLQKPDIGTAVMLGSVMSELEVRLPVSALATLKDELRAMRRFADQKPATETHQ